MFKLRVPVMRTDFAHLDYWRIKPLGGGLWAIGAIHMPIQWTPSQAAFVETLAASPRHGMEWSDAEALGHIGATIPKECSRIAAGINRVWRRALQECARDAEFWSPPIIRNFKTKTGGYADVPERIERGFAFHSGRATMEAFCAALHRGFTGVEAQRLSAIVGRRFRAKELREPDGFRVSEDGGGSSCGWTWDNVYTDHAVWRAIKALCEANNDDPFEWPAWGGYPPSISVHFGMGWLSSRRRDARAT